MKVLIWGIGQLSWITANIFSKEEIIGYVDSFSTKSLFAEKPVYRPTQIKELVYDAILVSTIYGSEIYERCKELDIDLDKVIFTYGNVVCEDMNEDYGFVSNICGERLAHNIKDRYHLIRETEDNLNHEKNEFKAIEYKSTKMYKSDYIRIKTFELLAHEIEKNKIKGENAELGVFRGDFAQYINVAFPNKKLYLFDTFCGFDTDELIKYAPNGATDEMRDIFKNTSINIVMNKMKYPSNVIAKVGLFPDSVKGLEKEFAFVSLDCDWEESIYQGLRYFFPRLARGGYIMIHDYNGVLTCADKAIERYEFDEKIHISKVPICDASGSIVLTK